MKTSDAVLLTGALKISLNGKVVKEVKNLVVTAGKDFVASRMGGAGDSVMSHMAIGTGTTAAAVGDTTLEAEIAATRNALNTAGGVVVDNVITYEGFWDAGDPASAAITEAGIFNDATTGTMLARTVFPVINKGASDSMTISWAITIS